MEPDHIDYIICKRVMERTERLGLHESRALAVEMLDWVDDVSLGVVAEGVGLPPIIARTEFEASLWWLPEESLSKIVTGILMLCGFSEASQKYLRGKHKLSAAKIRKEQR